MLDKKEKESQSEEPILVWKKDKNNKGVITKKDLNNDFNQLVPTVTNKGNNNQQQPTIGVTVGGREQQRAITTKELLEKAKINPYQEIPIAPSVLSIDNISYGTLGNFSCITGKSKSRKTFFLALLIAASLDKKGIFQRIKTEISESTVLHFDTEQSRYHTQLVAKRVIGLVGSDDSIINYQCFSLRPFDNKQRMAIIEEAIYTTENVKLVVIDGIADLIVGYNNEEEAFKVINKFMKWTADLNIHIITVVHQNKGDNNAKGHLGSLILQKAETVLSITKDREISTVESTASRGIDILPISFRVDDNGLPYFVDFTPKNTSYGRKTNPTDYDIDFHKNVLRDIFKDINEIKSTALIPQIKYALEKQDINIGDSALRSWKIHYEKMSLIKKENQQKPYKLNFF